MNILQQIFSDHYEEIKYTLKLRPATLENIEKMIHCGDPSFGGAMYGCSSCGALVLMHRFDDYYNGYVDKDGKDHPGYAAMIEDLETKFPLAEPQIIGEKRQKDFILLFGSILRMRNLLSSFDEFSGREILSERDMQDYLGRYQDLRDEWIHQPMPP